MKIKANQSLYKNIMIAFASLVILMGSLGYFLGFNISRETLLFYIVFLISTILFFLIVFLIVDKVNNKYFIFDEEKVIEKKHTDEKVILYYNQILYTKYHNQIDLLYGIIDFGYVEIVYKTSLNDKQSKQLCIYLSKKNYNKIFT